MGIDQGVGQIIYPETDKGSNPPAIFILVFGNLSS